MVKVTSQWLPWSVWSPFLLPLVLTVVNSTTYQWSTLDRNIYLTSSVESEVRRGFVRRQRGLKVRMVMVVEDLCLYRTYGPTPTLLFSPSFHQLWQGSWNKKFHTRDYGRYSCSRLSKILYVLDPGVGSERLSLRSKRCSRGTLNIRANTNSSWQDPLPEIQLSDRVTTQKWHWNCVSPRREVR